MLTSFDKAIVALILSGLGVAALKLPALGDPAVQNAIITIATPAIVALGAYLVPNKKAAA